MMTVLGMGYGEVVLGRIGRKFKTIVEKSQESERLIKEGWY